MSDQPAVALVNMPFSYSKYPSIQLGTLSALLKSKGIGVDCHYLHVRFAHQIGAPLSIRMSPASRWRNGRGGIDRAIAPSSTTRKP